MTKARALTTLLLLATVAALSVFAAPAAAAKPCWVRLVNDWYDGRIDQSYTVSCYRAAIKNLPDDVRAYSDARDDINRALMSAIRNKSASEVQPGDVIPAEPANGNGNGNGGPDESDEEPAEPTPAEPGDEEEELGGEAAPPPDDDGGPLGWIEPANADAIPLPLLILAGLALLLLALAAGGFVTRRVQARRLRLSPRPPDEL